MIRPTHLRHQASGGSRPDGGCGAAGRGSPRAAVRGAPIGVGRLARYSDFGPAATRAGNRMTAASSAKTPATAMPKSRNGSSSSQTTG